MSFYNGILNHYDESGSAKGARGSPGIGFKLNLNNDYDMQNKKLVNVKNGVNGSDVVTKSQLDTKTSLLDGARTHGYIVNNKAVIYSQSGAVHAKSFYLQDQNEDEVRILTDNQDFDNVHLFVPNLENFDGFGGRKRSEIMVISVDQTVSGNKFFQNIKAPNPSEDGDVANKNYVDFEITKQNVLIDDEFVKKSGSLMTGDLILPHYNYPVQGNTNKAISYETQREIFASRKETFPMETSLDMNNNVIENIATPTSSHQATNKDYCDYNFFNKQKGGVIMGPLSMNRNDLFEIPAPKFGSSAVNKNYVDGEITKNDTSSFVKLDGSRVMTGNLDMGNHSIKKVGEPINADEVATKNYVDGEIGFISTPFLKLDGTRAMTGVLNMNDYKISNLKMPEFNTDAANKQYIDEALLKSHLLPSHKENAFKYLLNRDESSSERNITVNGIVDYDGSPHKNKKAYDIVLIYTQGTQNYDSQIGINIYPLPVGKFTIIMEYYYPENIGITVSCQASTAIIDKQISKNFSDYIKLLVQFEDQAKQTPDYLYFNIRGSGTTSTNPEGYLVFYGMKEWYDSVNPEIYDHALEESMFEYDNDNMKMFRNIDMNNNKIKNLPQPTDDDDAASKIYIDKINTAIQKKFILDFFHNTKDFAYKSTFGDGFYNLIESRFYHLKQNVSGIVIDKIMPNLFLETDRFIADYNPKYGLKLSIKSHVKVGKIFNQNNSFTFFMSFLHDNTKTGEISFSNTLNSHIKFYPRYRITSNKLIIDYQSGTYETQFTNDFQNKQLFIWICFDGSQNLYKMALSNYSSHVSETFNPPVNFLSRQFEIDYDVFVNKIGFTDKFIDIDNMEFHRIMLEEKQNGSYFV